MLLKKLNPLSANLVAFIYGLLPIGLIATVINGFLITFIHWNLVPHIIALIWLATLTVTTILRFLSYSLFTMSKEKALIIWNIILVTGIIISGITWGAASVFMLFHDSLSHDVLIAFVLGGMCAGASASFAALRKTYLAFIIPVLVPPTIVFFSIAEPISITMGLMLILFSILITFSAEANHKMIVSAFNLRFEKEDLITQLTEEKILVSRSNIELQHEITRREALEKELLAAYAGLEKKVLERTSELAETNEKLRASNSELSAFTHSVSHDLRSPLLSIDGLLSVLQEDFHDSLGEKGLKYLEVARKSIARMGELINDLLTLSKVGKTDLARSVVNLSAITLEILEDLKMKEPHRKVDVTIQSECFAECDPKLVRIAQENLLNNAWKFTQRTEKPHIEFGRKVIDNQTVFYVSDNGVGFNMNNADKLFQPFQRLHSNSTFPGTGIGLTTVKRIIQRHGGKIWAESEPGNGATFYFTLQ